MYEIVLSRTARKQLEDLPKSVLKNIDKAIRSLATNPRPRGVKKLQGEDELYRIRKGAYRIIYQIADNVLIITVITIRHRREVYRNL